MRSLLLYFLVSCCIAAQPLRAQDAPLPKPETQDPASEGAATPAPAAAAPRPDLIPADILPPPDPAAPAPLPNIPTIEQLDEGLKPPPPSAAAENHRLHVEWRRLRNVAQNDPRVKAALARADAARTDLERRKLLARYFEIFHARMIALAPPEMKNYLLDRQREAMAALPQPRVRPETAPPPAPPGAPAPVTAQPTPSPTPKGQSLFPRFSRP